MATAARPVDTAERAHTGNIADVPNQAHALQVHTAARGEQQRDAQPELPSIGGMKFSRDQIELIKRTIAKGATDDELQLFIMQCERMRLDPFARQIYCVKRWDSQAGREVAQTQVSIDGMRLVAERSGKYAGQLPVQWADTYLDANGAPHIAWYDVWPFAERMPYAARARVVRSDFREPIESVARFDAYKQAKRDGTLTGMWKKMPDVMIAKVAEALGLRKAFPHELSGVYSTDEMAQASSTTDERPAAVNEDGEDLAEEREPTLEEAMAYPVPGRPGEGFAKKGGEPLGEQSNKLLLRMREWAAQQIDKPRGYARAGELIAHLDVVIAVKGATTEDGESKAGTIREM